MTDKGAIMVLTPWPSAFDMAGGGGWPGLNELVSSLIAAGFGVDVIAPAPAAGEPDWFGDTVGLRVHRYKSLLLPAPGYLGSWIRYLERTLRITACALRVARTGTRPRAVYAISALTIPAGAFCGALLRRPKIGELLGTYLYPHLGEQHVLLKHFEEVIAFKSPVDRLLILNDGTKGDEVARRLGVPESRVRFWMYGLDLDACASAMAADGRTELQLPAGVPLVVSTSRLATWKRVDRILRAVPDVLASNPDALFVFSGDGPERGTLETLVDELGIAHAVRFLGPLPRETNLRLIASADVVCALYDYSCVGVALLEALGCARAVVVADTGGTRDFVRDGVNGLVVKGDDAKETADAIASLLADAELRTRLGREARRIAESEYLTPAERASFGLGVVEELLEARSRAPRQRP